MDLPFHMDGAPGCVTVTVDVNDDPEALGCAPAARGFPYCSATVRHPARGYAAALGWIQLVRSTDGVSSGDEFEMDPYEPLGHIPHPFAFFGFLPTLFDAPSRDPVIDMDWLAHSFLCRLTEAAADRQVTALAGFAWGFSARRGRITLTAPQALAREAWDSHRQLLASEFPEWSFSSAVHAGRD